MNTLEITGGNLAQTIDILLGISYCLFHSYTKDHTVEDIERGKVSPTPPISLSEPFKRSPLVENSSIGKYLIYIELLMQRRHRVQF